MILIVHGSLRYPVSWINNLLDENHKDLRHLHHLNLLYIFSIDRSTSSVHLHVFSPVPTEGGKTWYGTWRNEGSTLSSILFDGAVSDPISSIWFLTSTVLTWSLHPYLRMLCKHWCLKTSKQRPCSVQNSLSNNQTTLYFQLQWTPCSLPMQSTQSLSNIYFK